MTAIKADAMTLGLSNRRTDFSWRVPGNFGLRLELPPVLRNSRADDRHRDSKAEKSSRYRQARFRGARFSQVHQQIAPIQRLRMLLSVGLLSLGSGCPTGLVSIVLIACCGLSNVKANPRMTMCNTNRRTMTRRLAIERCELRCQCNRPPRSADGVHHGSIERRHAACCGSANNAEGLAGW